MSPQTRRFCIYRRPVLLLRISAKNCISFFDKPFFHIVAEIHHFRFLRPVEVVLHDLIQHLHHLDTFSVCYILQIEIKKARRLSGPEQFFSLGRLSRFQPLEVDSLERGDSNGSAINDGGGGGCGLWHRVGMLTGV